MIFSFTVFPLLYYMYRIALLGGADMLAYLFLTFTIPYYPLVLGLRAISPMPFLVLLYASILAVLFGMFRFIRNLRDERFWEFVKEKGLSKRDALHYAMSGRIFSAKEYLNTKFWYLLERIEEKEDGVERKLLKRINLEEEPEEHKERIRELIEKGKLKVEEKVLASYGTPFLVYMLGGFILALLIGDSWLRALFG